MPCDVIMNCQLKSLLSKRTTTIARKCSPWPNSWNPFVRRGDVFRFRLPKGTGHEQYGPRFGVVVQADAMLPRSVVLIAPTSISARAASFRPEIRVAGETTRVLVEQVGAVDSGRLGELVDHLAPEELWGIDESLRTVLDLH